ncbi:MAG: HD domain-containing protein [Clostridiales bacterium]|nr:HD domain-containing protein [Candidatus Equinaster intestinalis]
MPHYETLSPEIAEQVAKHRKSEFAFDDKNVLRRNPSRDTATAIRPPFIRDTDKILNCPFYNRYADKTQVFSFYKNDDISRRGLHVQLVSRTARTLGAALGLNLELIEAIALGHDIGHTPFGHAGEKFLDEIYAEHTGRHFAHNIHSVRVLDSVFPYNITLQTLCGIASHDGELELSEYRPAELKSFGEFDTLIEKCYLDKANIKKLVPNTLEGCVVRISDIIAYLGKDRQDAERARLCEPNDFESGTIGAINAEIINNLMVNIIENSFGKPYIKMDSEHFAALQKAKADNYALIYQNEAVEKTLKNTVRPMMHELFEKLLNDLISGNKSSPIFTHHIAYVNWSHYERETPYEATEPNQIVTDYIASMTDDYFIDLYSHLFPKSGYEIKYKGYFD